MPFSAYFGRLAYEQIKALLDISTNGLVALYRSEPFLL